MDPQLLKYLTRLNAKREKVFEQLNGWDDDALNHRPIAGKWSLGQVLYHLYMVEKGSLAYMQKKILDTNSPDTTFQERLRLISLKVALKLPLKYKAPRVVEENIPEKVDVKALMKDWANNSEHLWHFVQSMDPKIYDRKIFRHPIIGLINIRQTLSFYNIHFDHHLPQINHLLSKLNSRA